ncbi:unnamed protein product [Bursaphelenchus okinawaensis]|uniref:ER membrane protein complex subunit 1 n=1 Tax=Bursaphelenchus okinawaensis TaxID=465554 RepID=A0A811K6E0_9BILA|nr:unnamed protein product [Bursaphelenchus okinawaensis]CAG9093121.1 unnamed protein product [Bursaphelenchus okinawaensis]
MRTLLIGTLLFGVVSGLFEDQIGKWDWRFEGVGCPVDVHSSRRPDGRDILILSSVKNVVASINLNSGIVDWRQLNEENRQAPPRIRVTGEDVITLLNDGEYVRVFDVETGTLKAQRRLFESRLTLDNVAKLDNVILLLVKNELKAFEAGDSPIWNRKLDSEVEWKKILIVGRDIVVLGKNKNARLSITTFNIEGKQLTSDLELQNSYSGLVYSGRSLSVLENDNVKAIYFKAEGERIGFTLKVTSGELLSLGGNFFVVKGSGQAYFLEVTETGIKNHYHTNDGDKYAVSSTKNDAVFAVYYESTKKLRILHKKDVFDLDMGNKDQASVEKLSLTASEDGQQYQIVLTRRDCRIDFFEGRRTSRTPVLEWSRFEGLTDISSVEMIDLPLSDSQATIESEFSAVDAPLWKQFLLRIYGQTEQLKHSIQSFINKILTSLDTITKGKGSITVVVRDLFGLYSAPSRTLHAGSFVGDNNDKVEMERDYFNLRKIVVVSTLQGSVYGIHSDYGVVMWSVYLGNQFAPLTTQLNEQKVPLFIQRSTAHYQYKAQAAVVYNLKAEQKSKVLLLNPVNGEIQNSYTVYSLKRAELAPFANEQQLTPLLLIDTTGKTQFIPPLPASYQPSYPVYLFNVQISDGLLSGGKINTTLNAFEQLWETKLGLSPDEKIKAIQGKPAHQKVHSQGKVLGDRNVLYKYSNPNLVAILTIDNTHTTLSLYLVDAVTGEVIHVAKHNHGSEPVNLLHCENWITYTYWNELTRRTEIGVIELYEGLEQTNAEHFNSYTSLKKPLEVISKSFVFPQGVSALGASDTELGLTTRAVLIAMPFGGVTEVSRRILDARRPLEMTPELREEMIVPYIPEIPIATEDLINYNQTVFQIKAIKTSPSGLESTSLMLAYGLDMFYTRLTPSGTFDILKDDFDYILISLVMVALVVASVVCKKLSRYQTLKNSWA